MRIKCWGSRGSIPVSGREYVKYGGDTTCIEIRAKSGDILIVDAGTGIRRLGKQLVEENLYQYHLIFTHAHWDHLMGLPFFKPLYRPETVIKTYRCPFPKDYVEKMISRVMTPPHFPIRYSDLKAEITFEKGCPDSFTIGSVSVTPIRLSHPGSGSGYKFTEDGKTFVFLTDNELGYIHDGGLAYDDYLKFSEGADLLFHDAEYTPAEYGTQMDWGHSVYTDVISLAISANVRQLGLFHLNQDRTDDQMDEILNDCHRLIAEQKAPLDCFAVACDMQFEV
ncbi:MAG: MBL fold metallo-hydrolase [Thermodesulfobacteriota bacterium]|nr:MBL fold metallo-hydrolase [Thermodesulfobacteriota bacterium]